MFVHRLTEKQEQLLGIHKRFKAEVEQHLQECGSLIEDLEEHDIELKRSVEKQSMNIQSQSITFVCKSRIKSVENMQRLLVHIV